MRATARRTGPFSLLLAVLAGALIALAGAPAALAHSALVSSNPADGSTVAALPAVATLTFNEDINGDFSQVVVQGSGEPRNVPPSIKGPVVTAALPADLGTGKVVVRYRVVSKDGHPISGEIAFTVAGAAGGTSGASAAAPSPGSGAGSTASMAASGTSSAGAASASPRPTAASSVANGSDNIVAYVLTGFVAVAMLTIGLLLWRWEKQRHKHGAWKD
ncbi:MAG: copper resistance protein CopC [Austwickia sp.]|nr:MAG: copper resistance protein CopC [Austwickia sp.]